MAEEEDVEHLALLAAAQGKTALLGALLDRLSLENVYDVFRLALFLLLFSSSLLFFSPLLFFLFFSSFLSSFHFLSSSSLLLQGSFRTPLWWAAHEGHEAAVRLLLDRGADPNVLDEDHESPLLRACYGGSESVVRLLVCCDADPTLPNRQGQTALHFAAMNPLNGHVLAPLLKADADLLNARDVDGGFTALHYAVESGSTEMVKCLIGAGADVNLPDGSGNTPLHHACRNDNGELIRLLVREGNANVKAMNDQGQTPQSCATTDVRAALIRTQELRFQ